MRTYNESEIELQMSTMLKFKYYGTPWNVNKIQLTINWDYLSPEETCDIWQNQFQIWQIQNLCYLTKTKYRLIMDILRWSLVYENHWYPIGDHIKIVFFNACDPPCQNCNLIKIRYQIFPVNIKLSMIVGISVRDPQLLGNTASFLWFWSFKMVKM